MRREPALILGAVGSLLVLVLQVILGTADVSTLGPAIETAITTLLPLIVGAATRGAVWAKASVDKLLDGSPDLVRVLIDTYGKDAAVTVLRDALARAERALPRA